MLSALTLMNLVFLAAAQQPHIVFVFIDDLGWNDVGYHGSEIMVRKGVCPVWSLLGILYVMNEPLFSKTSVGTGWYAVYRYGPE